jgi:hypothetical protein
MPQSHGTTGTGQWRSWVIDEEAPAGRSKKQRPTAETTLKTFTALFALVAAVMTFWTTRLDHQKNQAEDQSAQLEKHISALNKQIQALELQLERQTTTTAGTAGADAPVAGSPSDAAFTRRLVLTLDLSNDGDYANIDLAKGVVRKDNSATDLSYDHKSGQFRLGTWFGTMSLPVQGSVGRTECTRAVDTQPASKPITKLVPRLQFCATGNGGGVALLRVAAPPAADGTLVLTESYWAP